MAERNHEVERIYMSKLRDVESAVWMLEKKKGRYEREIKELRRVIKDPEKPEMPNENNGVFGVLSVCLGGFCGLLLGFIFLRLINGPEEYVYVFGIFGILLYPIFFKLLSRDTEARLNDYNEKLEKIEIVQKKNAKIYEQNNNLANIKANKVQEINYEIGKAKSLSNKLYDANWIPKQYRNIKVIYYICDMVTTSEISIEEALKYYLLQEANNKLDVILERLDKAIEQQHEIVVKQAVIESQNNELIMQNKNMLSKVSNIETNAQLAADYAKVGAAYSEASAYFSLATYLKD